MKVERDGYTVNRILEHELGNLGSSSTATANWLYDPDLSPFPSELNFLYKMKINRMIPQGSF